MFFGKPFAIGAQVLITAYKNNKRYTVKSITRNGWNVLVDQNGKEFPDKFRTSELTDLGIDADIDAITKNLAKTRIEGPRIEGPKIEGPKIEGPKIEGPKRSLKKEKDFQVTVSQNTGFKDFRISDSDIKEDPNKIKNLKRSKCSPEIFFGTFVPGPDELCVNIGSRDHLCSMSTKESERDPCKSFDIDDISTEAYDQLDVIFNKMFCDLVQFRNLTSLQRHLKETYPKEYLSMNASGNSFIEKNEDPSLMISDEEFSKVSINKETYKQYMCGILQYFVHKVVEDAFLMNHTSKKFIEKF